MHGNVWEWCQDWLSDNLPGETAFRPRGDLHERVPRRQLLRVITMPRGCAGRRSTTSTGARRTPLSVSGFCWPQLSPERERSGGAVAMPGKPFAASLLSRISKTRFGLRALVIKARKASSSTGVVMPFVGRYSTAIRIPSAAGKTSWISWQRHRSYFTRAMYSRNTRPGNARTFERFFKARRISNRLNVCRIPIHCRRVLLRISSIGGASFDLPNTGKRRASLRRA